MDNMGRRYSKPFRYIISLAVALVLLWFSFRGVKWDDFISGLRSCRWEFILLSMAASIVAFYVRGLRWRELLLPIDPSIRRVTTFNAVNIGYIANFVFPRIGEFVRCGVITGNSAPGPAPASSSGHSSSRAEARRLASYDKVLGTVVLERSWDMVTMILFLVCLLVFRWDKFGGFFSEKMWTPLEESIPFSIWWLGASAAVLLALVVFLMIRYRNDNAFCRKLFSICRGLLQGVGSCLKMPRKWLFFAYTAVIWAMYWLMSASTMWALPDLDSLNIVDALFLMVAGSLGWLVPVPGGFGAFHFIVSLALETIYGIPFGLGIIFATLSHESQAITMAVCGGGSYLYEALRTNRRTTRAQGR